MIFKLVVKSNKKQRFLGDLFSVYIYNSFEKNQIL